MSKTIADIFRSLSHGHLSNLSIGGEGSGEIPVQHRGRVTSLLNDALTEIHGRFNLSEKELIIRATSDRTQYPLRAVHAMSQSGSEAKFIMDTLSDPFTGDVLKLLVAADEGGYEVPINDPGADFSLFTPTYDLLEIPAPLTGDFYYLIYQANHAEMFHDAENPDNALYQNVRLPSVLYPAVEAFVASKIYGNIAGAEQSAKGAELFGLYDMICAQAVERDSITASTITSISKLEDRGFT
jgi:hypothetical protein